MATTKIWPVYGNIEYTIDYVGNAKKTTVSIIDEDGSAVKIKSIDNVINYAAREDAVTSHEKRYVSAINCTYKHAYDEFILIKEKYGKLDKILAHHGYQSFKPGEVTPDEAHMIGVELAKRLWGDRFQVVVTTHLDKAHIHNHFVLNSVSFIDGKKFLANKESYFRMRKESDELCRMYGKSIVEKPKYNGITRGEFRAEKEGRYSFRKIVFEDIDRFIQDSRNIDEFLDKLKNAGYTPNFDRMYLRIFIPGHQTIRLDRKDSNYSLESIIRRIEESNLASANTATGYRKKEYKAKTPTGRPYFKYKGYKALYVKTMHELGQLPKPHYRYSHIIIREELMNAGKLGNEMRFLIKNNIQTKADLNKHKESLSNIYKSYSEERRILRNRIRRAKGEKFEALKKEIAAINDKIGKVRKELYYCKDISERSEQLNDKISYVKQKDTCKDNKREMGGSYYEWSK